METIIAKIKHKDDAAALEAAQIEADNQKIYMSASSLQTVHCAHHILFPKIRAIGILHLLKNFAHGESFAGVCL